MSLTPGQRIDMIRECATLLDKEEWADLDLILRQHGLPTTDDWSGDNSKRGYVVQMTDRATDGELTALHGYMTKQSDGALPDDSPFKGSRLRVFASHLSVHREEVGEVAQSLQAAGVDCFVAHDSIEPSKEWQNVIESGLSDCDAMVVFLRKGFHESPWCDQEVGWVMGRRRPILVLAFDEMPKGFLGKLQARKCKQLNARQIAQAVLDWAATQQTLDGRLAESLTSAFEQSRSYDGTRATAARMESVKGFNDDQLDRLERAAADNSQVRDCNVVGQPGPAWVREFIAVHRSPSRPDPWSPF